MKARPATKCSFPGAHTYKLVTDSLGYVHKRYGLTSLNRPTSPHMSLTDATYSQPPGSASRGEGAREGEGGRDG